METVSSKLKALKAETIQLIKNILKDAGINHLDAYDIDPTGGPAVEVNPLDPEFTYCLDSIYIDSDDDSLNFCASTNPDNEDDKEYDEYDAGYISADLLVGVWEWLEKNKANIK